MGKKKKSTKSKGPTSKSRGRGSPQSQPLIDRHPHLVPVAALTVLLLIFFNDVMFGGKTFLPPDTITSKSVQPFVQNAFDDGTYPLWNPYIFSGMPSFASLQSAPFVDLLGDIIYGVYWVLEKVLPISEFTRNFFNYLLLGLFTYIFLIRKSRSRIVALFAALALVFQPQVISFTAFGHNTKIATAVFIPLNFLLLDELLEKRQLRFFALLALAVGLQLLRAHTQIAYYSFMMMGLYIVFWLVESVVKKRSGLAVAKSLGAVTAALVVGVLMSSWLYLSVLEYAEYSIRGGGAGLDYGYATNWSFHPIEMVTFVVPSFMGFGGNTYWGQMPFTDYPLYPGIIVLFMAGMAFLVRRDRYVLFFGILAFVALVISFGKHLPILYGPLFEFLPFFNKFRVPNMIHILVAFALTALAGFGLHGLMSLKEKLLGQKVKTYVFVFAGVCILFALVIVIGKGFYLSLIADSAKSLAAAAAEEAYQQAAVDAVKLLALIAAAAFVVFYFLQDKLSGNALGIILIGLLVLDLWVVDFKLADPQPERSQEQFFAENDAVRFLKQQDEPLRIYPVYDDKPETWYMYHLIQNVRGYHAAKLKVYQTFLERTGLDARGNIYGMAPLLAKYLQVSHGDGGQPAVSLLTADEIGQRRLRSDYAIVDMLNIRYLISHYPIPDPRFKKVLDGRPAVFENIGVLPRAFFVDEIEVLDEPERFFDILLSGQFDPAKTAYLEEEPPFEIEPSTQNRARVTSYEIHEITIEAEVEKPALLVLSEIYYPAGWRAFVDGEQTRIFKTNYLLRSIMLPPGEHEIRVVFEPTAFTVGLWLTFGILVALVGLLIFDLRFRSGVRSSRAQ